MGTLDLNQVLFQEPYKHLDKSSHPFFKNGSQLSVSIGRTREGYYFGRTESVRALVSQFLNASSNRYGSAPEHLRNEVVGLAKSRLTADSYQKFSVDFNNAISDIALKKKNLHRMKSVTGSQTLEIANCIALQLAALTGKDVGFKSETINQIGPAKVTIIIEKIPTT